MSDSDRWTKTPPPIPEGRGMLTGGPAGTIGTILLIVVVAVLALPMWVWYWWRIEPGPDEIAVLIRKTGKDLPSGQILALSPDRKGIQLDVLAEGRYFRNPYAWDWRIEKITDIPAGKLGVQIRLFGDDLPPGEIISEDGRCKGILKDVYMPGKYRINPYAYDVRQFNAITIQPGYVGVVTALTGKDVLNSELPVEARNTFLAMDGNKGVQSKVLDPGTYYMNPYMFDVVEVNLQSQRFQMSGEDVITFLTADGFTITVEGTIEYAIMREKAAMLTHQIGEMEDILKKVILPRARGFSRIEGSKYPAKNFITGDTRQQFQNNLEGHLQKMCDVWGVDIKSVLIRNITPPDQIASVIRDREVAVQTVKKYVQQIEQAKSKAELTRQEMLAVQNGEKVQAETAQIRGVIKAKEDQAVRLTAAKKELEVAKLENEASKAQADAVLLKANGDKEVVRAKNEAEAAVLASQVRAFGSGLNLARHTFYEQAGPKISTILSGDGENELGGLLKAYVPAGKEVGR